MSQALLDTIPSVDLAEFTSGDPARKAAFVAALGEAFTNIGFVAVKGHGLSDDLQKRLYGNSQAFFDLPDEVKQKYEHPEIGYQRGYTGRGKESAKGSSTGDLKEFYHFGQTVSDGDPIAKEYPENVLVEELPAFNEAALESYATLEKAGKNLLRSIAIYLDLAEDFFEDKVHNGNSILRPIHYYPIQDPDSVPADAVRAAAHGDINLITLLMGASAEGLQVLRRDGFWIPITALPDQVVVNVGDMLDRLTNHKLKSTIHRVVNPPREKMGNSRYSIPFFMHPRSEMDLTCLESCIDAENPKLYNDLTAGAFLEERLRELGLRK
jgi:isopenicillin N synthase-like dioxygenase